MLEYVPGHFEVTRLVRPKLLSCTACERILQEPAPSRPLTAAGPGLLAHVPVAKISRLFWLPGYVAFGTGNGINCGLVGTERHIRRAELGEERHQVGIISPALLVDRVFFTAQRSRALAFI